MTLSVKWYT